VTSDVNSLHLARPSSVCVMRLQFEQVRLHIGRNRKILTVTIRLHDKSIQQSSMKLVSGCCNSPLKPYAHGHDYSTVTHCKDGHIVIKFSPRSASPSVQSALPIIVVRCEYFLVPRRPDCKHSAAMTAVFEG
jgi:hypothetical protein